MIRIYEASREFTKQESRLLRGYTARENVAVCILYFISFKKKWIRVRIGMHNFAAFNDTARLFRLIYAGRDFACS